MPLFAGIKNNLRISSSLLNTNPPPAAAPAQPPVAGIDNNKNNKKVLLKMTIEYKSDSPTFYLATIHVPSETEKKSPH